MKKRFCLFALLAVLAGSFISCDDTKTYAELLDAQKTSISSFMAGRGYTVTDKIPTTLPWPEGVFYKTKSGLYVHVLDSVSTVIDSIPTNTVITVRYIEYNMNDSVNFNNMYSASSPAEIRYNDVNTQTSYEDCLAWHEALDYVGDYGHVLIIAPAQLGWSAYSDAVTAHFYELRYTFWKP